MFKEYSVYDGRQLIGKYKSPRVAVATARKIALNGGSPICQETNKEPHLAKKLDIFKPNEFFVIRHPQYGTLSAIKRSRTGRVIFWRTAGQSRKPLLFNDISKVGNYCLTSCQIAVATAEEIKMG